MNQKYTTFDEALELAHRDKTFREIKPMIPINGAFILYEDQKLLSFCSHDYLALADNPDIKKNAIKFLLQHGITASSESQDLYLTCQQQLEQKLSGLLHRESALFFPSRYDANLTVLSTLGREDSAIFIDDACHPSLMQGAKASQARVYRFPHNRLDRLEQFLEESPQQNKIIVSESIFSLTGDVSNLPTLIELAEHFEALLCLDDSHAFGITGMDGMGLCAHLSEVDIITGSFSKACGAYGGYVACSETIRNYLVNFAPTKTSHLLPPPIIGAIDAAIDLIPQLEGEHKQLEQRSHWLRGALRELGFKVSKSNTPLISLQFESAKEVESLRNHFKKEQILVGPTRSFIDAETCPRLNIALNVCHMPDHLTQLVDAIKAWQTSHKTSASLASN